MNTNILTKMLSHIRSFIDQEMIKVNKRFDALPEAKNYDDAIAALIFSVDDVNKKLDGEIVLSKSNYDKLLNNFKNLPEIKEYGDTALNKELEVIKSLPKVKEYNDTELKKELLTVKKLLTKNSDKIELVSKEREEATLSLAKDIEKFRKTHEDKLQESFASLEKRLFDFVIEKEKENKLIAKDLKNIQQEVNDEFELKMLSKFNVHLESTNKSIEDAKSELLDIIKKKQIDIENELTLSFSEVKDNNNKQLLELHKKVNDELFENNKTINSRMDTLKGEKGDVGPTGKDGANGRDYKIKFFDSFHSKRGYDKDDSVLFNDKRYISEKDKNTDGIPSPKWRLLIPCMQGKKGEKGDVGPTGKQGPNGLKGENGKSVNINELRDAQIIEESANG